MYGKMKKAYNLGKEALEKLEAANIKKMDKNAESIKKMTEGLDSKSLKMLKDKVGDVFGKSPSTIMKWLKRLGILGGGAYLGSSWEKAKAPMEKAKGGYVKMKRGGSVKKRAKSSSKKSRGIGAAKRGTKFKGVF